MALVAARRRLPDWTAASPLALDACLAASLGTGQARSSSRSSRSSSSSRDLHQPNQSPSQSHHGSGPISGLTIAEPQQAKDAAGRFSPRSHLTGHLCTRNHPFSRTEHTSSNSSSRFGGGRSSSSSSLSGLSSLLWASAIHPDRPFTSTSSVMQLGPSRGFSSMESLSRNIEARTAVVGFVGLGNMGGWMARNVLQAGHPLVAHDVNASAVEKLVIMGASSASSAAEVAMNADVVVTMLPSPSHVLAVYTGVDGMLADRASSTSTTATAPATAATTPPPVSLPPTAAPSSSLRARLFIDSSTVDPNTSRALGAAAAARTSKGAEPLHVLDAPVSGGVTGAQAGTLTFMVGGPVAAYEAALPLLLLMGKTATHCGAAGTGSAAKLCNNLALAVEMAGVCEALALGQRLGLDAAQLTAIFNASSARCWSSETYNPVPGVMEGVPSAREYKGGFSNRLMAKDVGLAVSAGEHAGSATPLGSQVLSMYRGIMESGHEGDDFSSIFKHVYKGMACNAQQTEP